MTPVSQAPGDQVPLLDSAFPFTHMLASNPHKQHTLGYHHIFTPNTN